MRAQSMPRLRSPARIVIVAALAAGASTACSSSTSAPSGGTAADGGGGTGPGTTAPSGKAPCQLMLRADAEAAVGQPLPQNDQNPTLGMCDYNASDFTAGAALTVSSWDSLKTAATSGKGQPVAISGVGDEALNLNGSNGSLLYVRKGSEGFLLVLNGPQIDHSASVSIEEGVRLTGS